MFINSVADPDFASTISFVIQEDDGEVQTKQIKLRNEWREG